MHQRPFEISQPKEWPVSYTSVIVIHCFILVGIYRYFRIHTRALSVPWILSKEDYCLMLFPMYSCLAFVFANTVNICGNKHIFIVIVIVIVIVNLKLWDSKSDEGHAKQLIAVDPGVHLKLTEAGWRILPPLVQTPIRRQAIIWTNAGMVLIEPLGTNISEILIDVHIFSIKETYLKMSSGKCRPFCLGLNLLIIVPLPTRPGRLQ